MGQNRTEIAPWVRHKVGLPDNDKAVTDEKVYRDINSALRKMALDFDWPWLVTAETITLTSGDSTNNTPTGYIRTLWASIGDFPLRSVQPRTLQRSSALEGEPRVFSRKNAALVFYPTPNSSVTINHEYIVGETFLADDTDEVLCPDELIDIVYTYAAIEVATRLKDTTLRATLKDELNDWKRRAADVNKNASSTPQIGRVW